MYSPGDISTAGSAAGAARRRLRRAGGLVRVLLAGASFRVLLAIRAPAYSIVLPAFNEAAPCPRRSPANGTALATLFL
jgi:hypothetical protein